MEGFQCIRCGSNDPEGSSRFFVCHCSCAIDDIVVMRLGAVTLSSIICDGFLHESMKGKDGNIFHTRLSLSGGSESIILAESEFQKTGLQSVSRRLRSRDGNQTMYSFFYRCQGELFLYEQVLPSTTPFKGFQYMRISTSRGSLELNPWVRISAKEFEEAHEFVENIDRLEEEALNMEMHWEEPICFEEYMELFNELRKKKEDLDEDDFHEYVSSLNVGEGEENHWRNEAMRAILEIVSR